MLSNRQPKHVPLAFAVVYSVYLFAAFAIIGLPIISLVKGVPLAAWPHVYATTSAVFVPIALASCVMAYLFGRLAYSELALPVCILLFGAAMPIVVVGFLSIPGQILHGSFWKGIGTPDGVENVVFLFLLFGFIGALLYWSGFREVKKRQIADS